MYMAVIKTGQGRTGNGTIMTWQPRFGIYGLMSNVLVNV